eukprot:TRINITY_DN26867_c0_g1_i1.p1 TRINITY_DN26867_c0_g1~~TRINITY_DN26867_c0_g1_i1.p1  ORF type:complete len:549 (+),score=123.34 TRINITY_DN26867_c0_g1_i1:210-1649(+)
MAEAAELAQIDIRWSEQRARLRRPPQPPPSAAPTAGQRPPPPPPVDSSAQRPAAAQAAVPQPPPPAAPLLPPPGPPQQGAAAVRAPVVATQPRPRHGTGAGVSGCRECWDDPPGTLAVVVLAFRRSALLRTAVERLQTAVRYAANTAQVRVRVFVSQDGRAFPETTAAIKGMGSDVVHLIHDRDDSKPPPSDYYAKQYTKMTAPYYAIARHYGWVLNELFSVPVYQRVVILEEDITVAEDFMSYMAAHSPLLDRDPELMCVSAWNDNGHPGLVADNTAVYRSDFFPGLGWMLSRRLWEEQLSETWPTGFWDDWLRDRPRRQGRACIRPEVSRTVVNCGDSKATASRGAFCNHISKVVLPKEAVDWALHRKVDYLLADKYNRWFTDLVVEAENVTSQLGLHGAPAFPGPTGRELRLNYRTIKEFARIAQRFGLMQDEKAGVPRMAYRGCVSFRWKGSRVHLCDHRFPDFEQRFYLGGRDT